METQQMSPGKAHGVARRDVLKAGLIAGATLAVWPLPSRRALWAGDTGQPKRGGILRVRGYDPPHFDYHLTLNFKTNTTLSFVYSTLLRHKLGPGVQPGTFIVEPHVAERWDALDDTTYVFYLRKGVK
jgi:ABC-type transport system substrate-binding protein